MASASEQNALPHVDNRSAQSMKELDMHNLLDSRTHGTSPDQEDYHNWTSWTSQYLHSRTVSDVSFSLPLPSWRDCIRLLLPSFLGSNHAGRHVQEHGASEERQATDFLDGLRGIACILVINSHLFALIARNLRFGWGHVEARYGLWQLPIVRIMFAGKLAVNVFFIISGFALSVSTIQLSLHSRESPKFASLLTSSIFRRPFRLFLPTWASTLPRFICIRLGIMAAVTPLWNNAILTARPPNPFPWHESLGAQVANLTIENARMLDIFQPASDELYNPYNQPTWTIPLEFRASLMLYLTHAATYSMRPQARFLVVVSALIYAVLLDQTEMPLFWIGYLLAERFFTTMASTPATATSGPAQRSTVTTTLGLVIFIIGLWVGSIPVLEAENTPGYAWLIQLTPAFQETPYKWWHLISACCIVIPITLSCCPPLPSRTASKQSLISPHAILTSPVCRYLGKISFALYLVHSTVIFTVGTLSFYSIWSITGKDSTLMGVLGFILAYAITLGFTIWAADIFWRLVDQPSVAFARKLQRACLP